MKDRQPMPTYEELIQEEWEQVRNRLGQERTERLMRNGTTLEVAKQILQALNYKDKLPKI